MAPRPPRASRQRVTYREGSFEEGDDDDSFSESDVDAMAESLASSPEPFTRQSNTSKKLQRTPTRRKAKVSYKEESSEHENGRSSNGRSNRTPKKAPKQIRSPRATSSQRRSHKVKPNRLGAPKKRMKNKSLYYCAKLTRATQSIDDI